MSDLSASPSSSEHPWARPAFLCTLIAFTVTMRVIPHPWNFAPVGAVALFGGATFRSKWAAFGVPLIAMFISDIALALINNFENGYEFFTPMTALIYACYLLNVILGYAIRSRRTVLNIAGTALLGSVVFYLVTNFAAWWGMSTGSAARYTRDLAGLMSSYYQALPFFQPTLVGDAVFSILLFGGLALAERKVPALRPQPMTQPVAA